MNSNPIFNLLTLAAGGYLIYLWWSDTQTIVANPSHPTLKGTLPGASWARPWVCLLAAIGAVGIVGVVTLLELKFQLLQHQSIISWWMLPAMLGAAITEEVIFRGYLIVQNKGRARLIGSAFLFSLLFALIHPYLWEHTVESPTGIQWLSSLRIVLLPQPILATGSIFALSLWFYFVRFWKWNPSRSLLPCFFAHAAANLAVFIIKLFTGHVA